MFDLEEGDCANFDFNPDSERIVEVTTVDVVDCDEEHEAEVIQVGELNPDEDRRRTRTTRLSSRSRTNGCGREDLTNIFTVAPDEDSWNDDGGPYVCFEMHRLMASA